MTSSPLVACTMTRRTGRLSSGEDVVDMGGFIGVLKDEIKVQVVRHMEKWLA